MAIPDYQAIMLPLLRFAQDNKEHSLREAIDVLADKFGLTDDERQELLPSGQQATFDNRVGWARTYMKKAGLLKSTRRGYFQITERGLDLLKSNPESISNKDLRKYPEFIEFQTPKTNPVIVATPELDIIENEATPEEIIENAYQQVRQDLASDLLITIKDCSPSFFERLVVDLLVKMGYGGTRRDAGQAIGKSHDGGIDGIIKEDRLGLDIVYIQAKRWEGNVGGPEIQKFAGALAGQHANKGIFITTSEFTKSSIDFVAKINSKIVLIDGYTLAQLMIDYNIGVTPFATYEIKRVDSDYFTEE